MNHTEPWTRPEDERVSIQTRKAREALISFYAPCEPLVMRKINSFLKLEKRLPLTLIHRVMDTIAKATLVTKVMTKDEIIRYITNLPDALPIAIGPCACRLDTAKEMGPDARDIRNNQLDMIYQTPREVDVQIGACAEKFGKLDSYRFISKEELLEKEIEFQNMGLVSNVYVIKEGDGGICHCSTATCVPFLANEAIGYKSKVIIHGDSIAVTDRNRCNASGQCIAVCHFNARKIINTGGKNHCVLKSPDRCYGCGHCVDVCPGKAIRLAPRKKRPDFVAPDEDASIRNSFNAISL